MRGSRAARIATLAALLAVVAGVTYLAFFLFGPVYTICSTELVAPDAPAPPTTCRTTGWLEMQLRDAAHPGPIDVRPIAFLSAWTAAPIVALVGTRLSSRGIGVAVVALAFLVDASSIISMGGGFVFALLCGPLLLVALAAMLVSFAQSA